MRWNEAVKRDIIRRTEHRTLGDGTSLAFIGEHRLREVWRSFYDNLDFYYENVPRAILDAKIWILGHEEDGRERLGELNDIVVFASIFVFIDWTQWDYLFDTFIHHKICDKHLPLRLNQNLIDLGPFDAPFMNSQHMFLPPYLHANKLITLSESDRLPFLEEDTPDHPRCPGEKLKVQKVKVADKYYVQKDGSGRRAFYYARKYCPRAEAETMQRLREGLQPHKRLAKFQCGLDYSPQHFSILIDWADGYDLDYRLHTAESIVNPKITWLDPQADHEALQKLIIAEMANMVDAVASLHEEQRDDTFLYHMDLKPGNILVYYNEYPHDKVGRWKIADFGLSVIHTPAPTGIDVSQTPAKRDKGEFQPPEVDDDWRFDLGRPKGVNSLGDIWSLGAIMCLVLAYALNYQTGVEQIDLARKVTSTGRAPIDYCFYVMTPQGIPQLKRSVQNWLNQVVEDHPEAWVENMVILIKRCLLIKKGERPTAKALYESISKNVISKMRVPQPEATSPIGPILTLPESPIDTRTSSHDFSKIISPQQTKSTPSERSESVAISNPNERPRTMSRGQYTGTFPPVLREQVERLQSDPVPYLNTMDTKYKVSFCPTQGHLLVLRSQRGTILRPDSEYSASREHEERIEGQFSSALIRWPYMILITAKSGKAKFLCCDHEARSLSPNLEATYNRNSYSENTIAVSSEGEVVVMNTYKTLQLHDPTRPFRLEHVMSSDDHEEFHKIYFTLTNDALLACATRRFFVWEKVADTWGQSWEINKDKPYKGRCPRTQPNTTLSEHVLVYFRQRKAFLLHHGDGFFGIFLRQDGMSISKVVRCAAILCGAITPNDSAVYYIRRTESGLFFNKQYALVLYRRIIIDMQIHEEQVIEKLSTLHCDNKTTAQIMILEADHADKLYVFASGNPPLSFSLTSQPERLPVTRASARSRSSNAVTGLGLYA